jgi:prepilin-type N-terminal cleavage/methylation domain-containing protein
MIRHYSSPVSRGGFTLIELLAVIAIVAVLAALLIPMALKLIDRAAEAECTSRLRALGAAVHLFAAEHNGQLVPNGSENPFQGSGYGRAFFLLGPYLVPSLAGNAAALRASPAFRCPSHDSAKPTPGQAHHYNFSPILTMRNQAGTSFDNTLPTPLRLAVVAHPNQTPLAWDTAGQGTGTNPYLPHPDALQFGYNGPTAPNGMAPRHGPRCNVLFLSGRVAPVDVSSIDNFPWNGSAPARWPLKTVFDPLLQ